MKILVLGGTQFVGRYLVETLVSHNHEVTIFNRGQTNTNLFPKIERITGDRNKGLSGLKNRKWDCVLDVNGYLPRLVKDSANLLKDNVSHYTFISTLAVYSDLETEWQDENAELEVLQDESTEEINWNTYGGLKVLCEQNAENIISKERTLLIRPGYIVGPFDHTDRFTYWLRRIEKGGKVLAPGGPQYPIQFIYAGDLAEFTVKMIEQKQSGAYNVTGPEKPYTWGDFFLYIKYLLNSNANFNWVDEQFISSQNLTDDHLPMWTEFSSKSQMMFNCKKAIKAGLTFLPNKELINATLQWDSTSKKQKEWISKLEPELLALWKSNNL